MTKQQFESPFSKDYQREQKRRAILSEAASLFNARGARATTLDDISARLNLNKASLYYYVKSKDDLIYQCYMATCDTLTAMAEAADSEADSGAEKLAAFIRVFFLAWKAIIEGRQDHLAILSELRALKPRHRKVLADRYSKIQGVIQSFIRLGIEDGSLRDCREVDTALAIFGLLQLTVLWLPHTDPATYEQAAEDFIDIVFNGITAHGSDGSLAVNAAVNESEFAKNSDANDKRAAFCKAGSAIFNSKGFKGTSLDEITEVLQVTKGSFYHHVRDKDELLYECFRRSLAIIEQVQSESDTGADSGLEALQHCACELFRIQNTDAGPLIRFNLILSLSELNRREILADISRISEGFGKMIHQGIADGSVRSIDPFIAEQVLISAVDLSTELQWLRPVDDLTADCRSFFTFYFRGISIRQNYVKRA